MSYDLKHVQELIERAITEKGGDTIARCQYFNDNGKPVCIAGHVFAYDGFGPNYIREGQTVSAQPVAVENYDGESYNFLESVQAFQDAGGTWADAYESAKRELDRYRINPGNYEEIE